jgi:hypothetical protein
MLVLDVVARSFPRDNPTFLPEPGCNIPGLVRVFGSTHDGPSLLMCIEYTQQLGLINLRNVYQCVYVFKSNRAALRFGLEALCVRWPRWICDDLNIFIDYETKLCYRFASSLIRGASPETILKAERGVASCGGGS